MAQTAQQCFEQNISNIRSVKNYNTVMFTWTSNLTIRDSSKQ